jgi:hypothetical protein
MTEGKPGFFQNIGLAGSAAVLTLAFIHPIDLVKIRL